MKSAGSFCQTLPSTLKEKEVLDQRCVYTVLSSMMGVLDERTHSDAQPRTAEGASPSQSGDK